MAHFLKKKKKKKYFCLVNYHEMLSQNAFAMSMPIQMVLQNAFAMPIAMQNGMSKCFVIPITMQIVLLNTFAMPIAMQMMRQNVWQFNYHSNGKTTCICQARMLLSCKLPRNNGGPNLK